MIAPRPVLIGAATRDFFPIEGTRKTFRELQQLYSKLGVSNRIKMVEFNHGHSYSRPLREASYAWFDQWLKGTENQAVEPEILTEKDALLQCTVTGQVVTSLGGKRVQDFNRAEAQVLLKELEGRRRDPEFQRELAKKIRHCLGLASIATVTSRRQPKLEETEVNGLIYEKILLESEPGIVVPVRIIHPKIQSNRLPAVLALRDRDGKQDRPSLMEGLARAGRIVAVVDVRGFGETQSSHHVQNRRISYFDPRDGMDADFAYAALCLGRPLLGMRVWDALQAVEYFRSRPDVDPKRVSIVGRGWSAVTALFAASVNPEISGVAVEEVPPSYGEIAQSEVYAQPVSLFLPGVLHEFDLPDVFAQISPRSLLVLNAVDALTKKMDLEELRKVLEPLSQRYKKEGASDALEVRVEAVDSSVERILKHWVLQH